MAPSISYAQQYEDLHLLRCFGEQPGGFYIDVGAGHPVHSNVSFLFYLRGWSGLAVEPNSWLSQLSEGVRKRDRNIASLLGAEPGQAIDHINGIKNPDGSLAFPNAEIKVPSADWAHWMSDENMAKATDGFQKGSFGFTRKIFGNLKDKVTRFDWKKEVAPGITAVESSGHTPGHTSFVIASGSSSLFLQADVSIVPALFLRHPDWHVMFDSEPEKAVATRRRIYDMASADKLPVVGYHFPFPGIGHIEKAGSGYHFEPSAWNPVL